MNIRKATYLLKGIRIRGGSPKEFFETQSRFIKLGQV
jgi:hypothetical protein